MARHIVQFNNEKSNNKGMQMYYLKLWTIVLYSEWLYQVEPYAKKNSLPQSVTQNQVKSLHREQCCQRVKMVYLGGPRNLDNLEIFVKTKHPKIFFLEQICFPPRVYFFLLILIVKLWCMLCGDFLIPVFPYYYQWGTILRGGHCKYER